MPFRWFVPWRMHEFVELFFVVGYCGVASVGFCAVIVPGSSAFGSVVVVVTEDVRWWCRHGDDR